MRGRTAAQSRSDQKMALVMDDCELDDAELWQVIDSAAASSHCNSVKKPLPSPETPTPFKKRNISNVNVDSFALALALPSTPRRDPDTGAQVLQRSRTHSLPHKFPRFTSPSFNDRHHHPQLSHRTPNNVLVERNENNENSVDAAAQRNLWNGIASSAAAFKQCQNAAMSVLEKGDYMIMQGKPYIKKNGWRKIAFFFNISFEIRDKNIQLDRNSNVTRAEFVVRASMPGGRFADGWGSCDHGEKRFHKPNHDVPSTAETRAKTRACQDLIGIGEYKPGGPSS